MTLWNRDIYTCLMGCCQGKRVVTNRRLTSGPLHMPFSLLRKPLPPRPGKFLPDEKGPSMTHQYKLGYFPSYLLWHPVPFFCSIISGLNLWLFPWAFLFCLFHHLTASSIGAGMVSVLIDLWELAYNGSWLHETLQKRWEKRTKAATLKNTSVYGAGQWRRIRESNWEGAVRGKRKMEERLQCNWNREYTTPRKLAQVKSRQIGDTKSFSLKWEIQATARFQDSCRAVVRLEWHGLKAPKWPFNLFQKQQGLKIEITHRNLSTRAPNSANLLNKVWNAE